MDSLTPSSPANAPATVVDVLARLDAIADASPRGDGVACFTHLYRGVTASVADALRQNAFLDPDFVQRLDVVFAGLYFEALDTYQTDEHRTPRAWYPLFAGRARTDVASIQFALAGMNAHINRDLMVALVRTCGERSIAPTRDSREHRDYEAVNEILASTEASYKAEYLAGVLADADQVFTGVDDVIANWSVAEARDAAWAHAETLWALRGAPRPVTSVFIDTIDGLVGFAGRGLLVPTRA